MASFYDDCRDVIIDRLEEMEDFVCYGCDLGSEVMQGYYADGTYFYNRQKARDYLNEHSGDIGSINEEIRFNFGSLDNFDGTTADPFDNPEAYHVNRMGFVIDGILGPIMSDEIGLYDEEVTLTPDMIKRIQDLVEEGRGTDLYA